MEDGEECSSNESGWTKYIDPTSDYDDQNNYNRRFVHDDDDDEEEEDAHPHQHQHQHSHQGYNRRQRQYEDDDDSIASDASSGPGHHRGEEEEDDDHGNKFFKGKKSSKVVKGRKTEKYEGKGKKDMMLKMKKSTGNGVKQGQGQKPI